MPSRFNQGACLLLSAALALSPVAPASAAMISTQQALSADRIHQDRDKVQAFMNRADVQQKLQMLGIKPDFARQRVAALSDDEIAAVAGKIDQLPAGGNLSHTDLILILLIAILVIIAL